MNQAVYGVAGNREQLLLEVYRSSHGNKEGFVSVLDGCASPVL